MKFIFIMFHVSLIIWVCLTFVREDTPEHWMQIGILFFNAIIIGIHLEDISKRFTRGFQK